MAEFSEVMRQLDRLCSHYQNCSESGCPMYDNCGNIGAYCSGPKQSCRIEETVMEWAAENPEPVYPTWGEWFAERGELCKDWKDLRVISQSGETCSGIIGLFYNRIPADIAQKLEIEPKEE